ncbi:MAG: sugar transferase [Bryobacteraceae bacterium]|nr:sugar transferase [Bryobacteraceae bacterium]
MIRVFNVFVPASVVTLLFSEAILLLSCFVLAIYLVLNVDPEVYLLYDEGLIRVLMAVLSLVLGMYFSDLYANFRIRSRIVLFQQICLVVGVAFLVQALLSYASPTMILPKWVMIYGCGFVLLALPAWRVLFHAAVWQSVGAQKVLLVGESPLMEELVDKIAERPELGWKVIGFLREEGGAGMKKTPELGAITQVGRVAAEAHPDRIVVGLSERRTRLPMDDLLRLRLSGTQVEEVGATYEQAFGRVSVRELRPAQLVFAPEIGPNRVNAQLQSLYSLLIALIGLAIAWPVMLLVALLVKLSSPGPVLFRQTRTGKNDREFTLYKFRSMRADAEKLTGAVWASRDDPRITGLGKWLRKLRLDELPQLFNVLKGDMSIVGPRPERPEFVEQLSAKIPFYRQRHCVKPGITGWAQINHKYGDTIEDTVIKLEYDLYYIKNLSPALDFYIMFHTAKVMLLSRGAQ